jgi:glycosyltransferase involved in cell wall biosynthesis
VKICLVYDCLYPHTVGGAERWYRNLALRLATDGHDVTYLTMRQWEPSSPPELPGVRVVAVAPRLGLYVNGRRRIWPPLVFGFGVLRHLATHGSRYDVVHTASFPYFSLLAAGLLRRRKRYRLVVDWHEVWTREYWRSYLGPAGAAGLWVQRLCLRLPQEAFCFSQLHARRLRAEGFEGTVTVLRGQYERTADRTGGCPPEPLVVFAGRHIPEKGVTAIVPALAFAREQAPELRALILGDGPERPTVLRQIEEYGLCGIAAAPGFVDQQQVDEALTRALCLVLPSRREGYGLVVVEALAHGTPVVVVDGADNAAVELVEADVNGYVAPSASTEDLGAAILRVHDAGERLQRTTAEWFARNGGALSLESSLAAVSIAYGAASARS